MNDPRDRARIDWLSLYPDAADRFDRFWAGLEGRCTAPTSGTSENQDWYRDDVAYGLYVDLFAGDFTGLTRRLDYLRDLGVGILWLLPILDSPMADQGFDCRDYRKVHPGLLGPDGPASFDRFLARARELDLRIIFDLPINHCSWEHELFRSACASRTSPYRDWFIWSDDDQRYGDARVIFKGMVKSNWEWDAETRQFFFHRFYPFQPDLNYRNPAVLEFMVDAMLDWRGRGVAGFRLDAVPFLWKDEGTDCENRPGTHAIIRLMRTALDLVAPGTLLLAEACQPPREVVGYFGAGDECHAAYHFPLMPQTFLALSRADPRPLEEVLSPDVTPAIPEGCQWFTFLRCHDELTLEMVTPEQRSELHAAYCHEPGWDFRCGEGISARLADLLDGDPDRILLAYALTLSLPGTPLIYYGDELATHNDDEFYEAMVASTGYADTRFRVRGPLNWLAIDLELREPTSVPARVHDGLAHLLRMRRGSRALRRGTLEWLHPLGEGTPLVALRRRDGDDEAVALLNLGSAELTVPVRALGQREYKDLKSGEAVGRELRLPPYGFAWLTPRRG